MSIFVWVMIGVAFWHFAVLVPDRFYGGIIGALVAAVGGALVSGYLLPSPGIPPHNPPGLAEALWPIPGSLLALLASYLYGARCERGEQMTRRRSDRVPARTVSAARTAGRAAHPIEPPAAQKSGRR